MKLEGVIISVGYSDFLAETLPHNKQFFDYLVVVTDLKDQATKDLCEYHHVHCVKTDAFYDNGDKFNKGKGINEGLKILKKDGWVIHMDADIYLPPLTDMILNNLDKNNGFDTKSIYGMDRMMCPSYEEWVKFKSNPVLTHQGWIYVYTTIFPMGVRIAKFHTDQPETGYLPIGFFQMWNPKGSGVYTYPDTIDGADRTDLLMAQNFPAGNRRLIPEIVAIHLDSEGLTVKEMGKNWNGRKTALFGPKTEDPFYKAIPRTDSPYTDYVVGVDPLRIHGLDPKLGTVTIYKPTLPDLSIPDKGYHKKCNLINTFKCIKRKWKSFKN